MMSTNAPAQELEWRVGSCGQTEFSSRQDTCQVDRKGAWHVSVRGDPLVGAQRCAARCRRCQNCRYVSFSVKERDCSWYAECSMDKLGTGAYGHQSAHVIKQTPLSPAAVSRQRTVSRQLTVSRPPTLLVVYHLAKTGGTALMALLNGHAWASVRQARSALGKRHQLPTVLGKGEHACFYAMFPSIFDARARAGCRRPTPSWHKTDLVLEFHGRMESFWDDLEPRLPQLRTLYAARNGTCVVRVSISDDLGRSRSLCRASGCLSLPRETRARLLGGSRPTPSCAYLYTCLCLCLDLSLMPMGYAYGVCLSGASAYARPAWARACV